MIGGYDRVEVTHQGATKYGGGGEGAVELHPRRPSAVHCRRENGRFLGTEEAVGRSVWVQRAQREAATVPF